MDSDGSKSSGTDERQMGGAMLKRATWSPGAWGRMRARTRGCPPPPRARAASRAACRRAHRPRAAQRITAPPRRAAPAEEDARLLELVHRFGAQNWTAISRHLGGGRNGKSCRLRWFNQLDPRVNKEPFTEEEVGGPPREYAALPRG